MNERTEMKQIISRDSRGRYQRDMGWEPDASGEYKQHRFYLGKDRAQACIRAVRLELLWDGVQRRWQRDRETPRPSWDESSLRIALAVARGDDPVIIDPAEWFAEAADAFTLAAWFDLLCREYQGVPLALPVDAEAKRRESVESRRRSIESTRRMIEIEERSITGPVKLAAALDKYADHVRTRYTGPEGMTDYGGLVLRRINSLRQHLGDKTTLPLDSVDTAFIDAWVMSWQNRPNGANGTPVSAEWARGVIKTIRDFVRWLSKAGMGWKRPNDYEVLPARVKTTTAEVSQLHVVKRYKTAEVKTLWETAVPSERVFIALALNCGFGEGEIKTLRLDEITIKDGKGTIRRTRTKTGVYSEWGLWPETVAALEWHTAHVRPEADTPYLFVTKIGTPFMRRTKSGNRSQFVANAWDRLYQRVKDVKDFPKLSFNKLRKTGSNWIRRKYGNELADLYLGYGAKEVVGAYTDKPWGLVRRATTRYRRKLAAVFAAVSLPFPPTGAKCNRSVSLATIKRIKELRQQGYKYAKIAEIVKLSLFTVRRYDKAPI